MIRSRVFRQFGLVLVLAVLLTLGTVVYSREFNWPDYYHIAYGFPVAWLIRTLNTIAGPVDRLTFQAIPFLVDLIFWFVILAVSAVAVGLTLHLRRM